jgi:CRP-like cAMP-binding protein
MTSRLLCRLERHTPLSAEERHALDLAATNTVRRFNARDTLLKQGAPADRIFIVLDGLACRYKLLADGRRQISEFMLPGDLCDIRTFTVPRMDHAIAALSPVDVAVLSMEAVQRLTAMPGLARALARNSILHQSILREWLTNIGKRTAFERIAHLLCEISERLRIVGLMSGDTCDLPITQSDLGDVLALSSVHVNRMLMELRRSGLATFHNRRLVIHDPAALRRVAGFDPDYLHLDSLSAAA